MITLKSGVQIPVIGFGTDNIPVASFENIIQAAYKAGYQFFDTATAYQNHQKLAKAFSLGVKENPLICTKFNNGDLVQHKTVEAVVENILSELKINYIGCLLLHNPKVSDFQGVFKKLILLKERGIIKSIGVSNFTLKHFSQLMDVISHVDINEIEFHPYLTQPDLISFCAQYNIKIVAYRPFAFGSPELLNECVLKDIAKNHSKTVSQVILRWVIQQGHCVIPKASSEVHLKENLNIFDFKLAVDEMNKINKLNKHLRTCSGPWADFDDECI